MPEAWSPEPGNRWGLGSCGVMSGRLAVFREKYNTQRKISTKMCISGCSIWLILLAG